MPDHRIKTGIPTLDDALGGGLIPGTLAVVAGATGIGKTQLGLQFAHHGLQQEGEAGIIFDMTARGDSQNQDDYARRLFDWRLSIQPPDEKSQPTEVWRREAARRDYLHIFARDGRRVTRGDLDFDDWKLWKIELLKKLQMCIYFFYGNFVHGVRRCVIDGVEPTVKAADSFQFHTFDYIYHQILRKEDDWVARDLFREQFRKNEAAVEQHRYNHNDVACLLLYTTHDVLLDDMLVRPIATGDVFANASTIIYMGKTREENRMGRALHVAKHRGSACDDAILPFEINERGLVFGERL